MTQFCGYDTCVLEPDHEGSHVPVRQTSLALYGCLCEKTLTTTPGRVLDCCRANTAKIEEKHGDPDGWMIVHHRMGDSCYFGPWTTLVDALDWWGSEGNPNGVHPNFIPMWKSVEWDRGVGH